MNRTNNKAEKVQNMKNVKKIKILGISDLHSNFCAQQRKG